MTHDTSIVQIPRDYSDIAKLRDPTVLEDFLDQPLTFIAETITGALATGKTGVAAVGGRIVQALLKGRLFEQWASEFKRLRDSGRIPDDFAETRYGFQTWVELMTIIDEEAPDPDRLEALKAMFFAVNKANVQDAERIAAYQLWQIAKRLTSGELYLLKVVDEVRRSSVTLRGGYNVWAAHMAQASGYGARGLIDLYEKRLTELYLLSPRFYPDQSGISLENARMTDLGIRFCFNLETYQAISQDMKS